VSHVPLGTFPTPVERLERLGTELGVGSLWVKRDDRSGALYGGNKVRKLEFWLAQALKARAREVLTFGGVGSNHALATAIYAQRLGLEATLVLTPQPVSRHVRETLLAYQAFGARILTAEDHDDAARTAQAYVEQRAAETGMAPFVIPLGGTSALVAAALVDTGMELSMQALQGDLPVPDVVYVALGSMGTAIGITLGLAVSERSTEVRAVRVTPETLASVAAFEELLEEACDTLCGLDVHCGCAVSITPNGRVVEGYFGSGYGEYSPEGVEAAELARREGLSLDGTYTAKAFAALVADARAGELADKTVVFWNTFSSVDLAPAIASADYRTLPEPLHHYFEQPVQRLDLE
jgi:D-cysteine desulfhydrase